MTETAPVRSFSAAAPDEVSISCRLPLLVLFLSAAIWLVIGSVLALIASIKFHSPNFLADSAWLTYGRVRPAFTNSMLYGFCLQAGLGVELWLLARLGRAPLAQSGLITLGAALWNLGVTLGIAGVLAGDSTGFETLEMPRYAVVMLFLGYLLIGVWGALTFHQRRERGLFVSQWFVLAAVFWFPWIYSTAELLLVARPVRGVAQSVIAWWYADNLQVVWLGLVGLGAIFYFVPKLLERDLHSHYLALFTFWTLILFGSWGGVPGTAPVPTWLPTISSVATVFMGLAMLTVALNVYPTACAVLPKTSPSHSRGPRPPVLSFMIFGTGAFIIAASMKIAAVLSDPKPVLHFTWFSTAQNQLHFYGFFAMVMFGAIYYILPQLMGLEFPRPKLVRVHLWLAAGGIVLIVLPLAIGGIVQGLTLANPAIAFLDVSKTSLHFLRVSTIGDLLLLLAQLVFLVNLAGLTVSFYRVRAAAAVAAMTADLFKTAEVKP